MILCLCVKCPVVFLLLVCFVFLFFFAMEAQSTSLPVCVCIEKSVLEIYKRVIEELKKVNVKASVTVKSNSVEVSVSPSSLEAVHAFVENCSRFSRISVAEGFELEASTRFENQSRVCVFIIEPKRESGSSHCTRFKTLLLRVVLVVFLGVVVVSLAELFK